jgi:hypothetical protein
VTATTTAAGPRSGRDQHTDAIHELAAALDGDGHTAAAQALTAFADALARTTADPLHPTAVPGWIIVEHDAPHDDAASDGTGTAHETDDGDDEFEDVVVALDPDGLLPLYEELCRIPDPERLRAAVILLLNTSVRLQQITGGAEASAQLMQTAAQLSPVLEAVTGGAPPLIGRAALQLTEDDEGQLTLTERHAQWLTGEVERLPAHRRPRTVLALAALAEQLGEKPHTRPAAQAVLAVAQAAAARLAAPEGERT